MAARHHTKKKKKKLLKFSWVSETSCNAGKKMKQKVKLHVNLFVWIRGISCSSAVKKIAFLSYELQLCWIVKHSHRVRDCHSRFISSSYWYWGVYSPTPIPTPYIIGSGSSAMCTSAPTSMTQVSWDCFKAQMKITGWLWPNPSLYFSLA